MSFRKSINRILKPLVGCEITKVDFDRDLWSDVKTDLAASEIRIVFDVGANEGQGARFIS